MEIALCTFRVPVRAPLAPFAAPWLHGQLCLALGAFGETVPLPYGFIGGSGTAI